MVASAQDSAPVPTSDPADLTRFDALNERGWNIPHPSVADTLVGDAGGVRSTLADAGIGFYGFLGPDIFEYDLTQSNRGKPRTVNGQVLTWYSAYQAVTVTFDTAKIGLDGGQLLFGGNITENGLQSLNGPDVNRLYSVAYNQILDGGKIYIQFGYYPLALHFVGAEVGGNIAAGSLGPEAFIPNEVGLSFNPFMTPAAEIKVDLGGGFSNHTAVQRGFAPGGPGEEARINPGAGLTFAPPGTGVLIIDELVYQKAASATQASTWIRGGGIYNTTLYKSFTNGQGLQNWALYLLGDRQLTSIDPAHPYRGLYVGASAMYAPPEQNLFTQYYEVRAYEFGPVKARPTDFASLVVSVETYSKEGQRALAPPPVGAFQQTVTGIGSYSFHVRPGLYVQPGFGVTTHPSVSREFNNSVNAYLALEAFF